MTAVLLAESRTLAFELRAVLLALDPARWRSEMAASIRARLEDLGRRLERLPDDGPAQIHECLAALRRTLEGSLPEAEASFDRWNELRLQLQRGYEHLAACLRIESIHVPSLRPSNLLRSALHFGNGVGVLILLEALSPGVLVWVAAVAFLMAWSMETGRRLSDRVNRFLMTIFSRIAHPHERYRVNSATWYITALLFLSIAVEHQAALLAVVVLAVSDPAAALVGRRFGRHTIRAGRSVEGTLAFVVAGAIAGRIALALFEPGLATGAAIALATTSAVAGALAELVSIRVDDNFSIPIAVAGGATLAAWLLGL